MNECKKQKERKKIQIFTIINEFDSQIHKHQDKIKLENIHWRLQYRFYSIGPCLFLPNESMETTGIK